METIYLVQHGLAVASEEDPRRPLSAAGSAEVERVARWAGAAGLAVAEIRHSGKLRARQTAERLAVALAPPGGVIEAPGLAPNDPVAPAVAALSDGLMLVGHLPFLARLAGLLVAGDETREVVRFRNAGVVCLAGEGRGWSVAWAVVPELLAA